MDVMQALGIDISCSAKTITWNGNTVPFRPANYFKDNTFQIASVIEDDPYDVEAAKSLGYRSPTILHSKYDAVSPQQVASEQSHLTLDQRADLKHLFGKFEKLFSGKLGKYPHKKVNLELCNNATPKAK